MTSLLDRVTNYRSRYGYPRRWALCAEWWWRVEHWGWMGDRLGALAYRYRKAAERRGHEAAGRRGR